MSRFVAYQDMIDQQVRNPSSPMSDFFRRLLQDLDGRITDTEAGVGDYREARGRLEEVVLSYLATKLEPEFERVRVAADLGLLLEARSGTAVTVATGEKTFVVSEEDKGRFSAPGYVGVFKFGDPGVFMAGARVSYDKASGTLIVDVDRIAGGGVTAADWQIVAVSGTDYLQAAALAEAARDAAEQHRDEAGAARNDALGHAGTANTHRIGAEEARDAAVVAKAGAEAAQGAAAGHLAGVQAIALYSLPPSASDPVTMPGGGALVEGAHYWNTSLKRIKTFDGADFVVNYVPATASVSAFNGRTGGVAPADGDYAAGQIVVSPAVAGAVRVQAVLAALEAAIGTRFPTASISPFMQTVLDDADQATARSTLGAAAATHNHAWGDVNSGIPGTISSLAGGTAAADKVWIYSGAAAGAFHTVTPFARSLLDDADQVTALGTLGAAASGHGHSNATGSTAGFMSATHYNKLEGIAAGANNYAHPTGDGNQHVPANGTGNANKVLRASGTAGSYSWGFVDYGEITGVPAALSAIHSLTPAADRLAYYTGAGTGALTTFTSLARSLVAGANQVAMLSTLGAAATSHVHPIATGSVAGFMSAAHFSKLEGVEAGAKASFTWAELGARPAALTSVGGLTPAADRVPYYTGSGTAGLATFTSQGRTIIARSTPAQIRTDLELGSMALQPTSYADWQLVASAVAITGASTAAFTGLGDYAELFVCFRLVSGTAATSLLRMQVGNSGGWIVAGSYIGMDDAGAILASYTSAAENMSGYCHIIGLRGSVRPVMFVGSANSITMISQATMADTSATLDRIRFWISSGTIDAGTAWIWGKI